MPGEVQNRVREFAAILLVKLSHLEKNPREDFLIHLRLAGRRHSDVFPLQPPRRIHERAVFLRESRAQASR